MFLYRLLPTIDLGLLQFRIAFLAVLTAIISCSLTSLFGGPFAILCSGWAAFSLICSIPQDGNKNYKMVSVSALIIVLAFTFGSFLGLIPILRDGLTIVFAFLSFYLRRYGVAYMKTPLFSTVIFVISSNIFPQGLPHVILNTSGAMVGVTILWMLNYWIFPFFKHQQKQYHDYAFYRYTQKLLIALAQGVRQNKPAPYFFQQAKLVNVLRKKIRGNLSLSDAMMQPIATYHLAEQHVFKQSALFRLLRMLHDNLTKLVSCQRQWLVPVKLELTQALEKLSQLSNLSDSHLEQDERIAELTEITQSLQKYIFTQRYQDESIMYLSNLVLCLQKTINLLVCQGPYNDK